MLLQGSLWVEPSMTQKRTRRYTKHKKPSERYLQLYLEFRDQKEQREWTSEEVDLVRDNMRLAYFLVNRSVRYWESKGYVFTMSHRDELESAAVMSLKTAALKYDSERNVKFSTFAWKYINLGLRSEFRAMRKGWHTHSFSELSSERELPISDTSGEYHEDNTELLLGPISFNDRQIVDMRFIQGLTLSAIGEQLGVSKERARQKVEAALERLRKAWRGKEDMFLEG